MPNARPAHDPTAAAPALERARAAFASRFGRSAGAAASAPGRVNLIGEHTDYSEGFVFPLAIGERAAAVIGFIDGPDSCLLAADLDEEHRFDLAAGLAPGDVPTGHWASYVGGTLERTLAKLTRPRDRAVAVALASDVPPGAGLSSSAAVEVATARATEAFLDADLDPTDRALLCQSVEHDYAGVPCGIMDQLISSRGVAGSALLVDCRSLDAAPTPLPDDADAIILIANTGVSHALADGAYAKRRRACALASEVLGVAALRDASAELIASRTGELEGVPEDRRAGEPLARRATHVVDENARCLETRDALAAGDLARVGELLRASHHSLRSLYEVSCDELDLLADAANAVDGCFGCRMTGGGFGGSVIALLRPDAERAVRDAWDRTFTGRYGRTPDVRRADAGPGARAEHP